MNVEQEIMSAVVRVDMFLVNGWMYMLVLIVIFGIGLLVIIRTRWK